MKLLVSLNSKELDDYLNYTNSFIIGLKDFSINYLELSVDEIKELFEKYSNIELFVSVNKNIFNKELATLEGLLMELSKLPIKAILFYDLSVLSLVKKNNLPIDLVLHQTHMVTSYSNCNYYEKKGVKYAYLSSEVTSYEMMEISEKTKLSLMALFIGHPIISHSKRTLLSNYFNYHHKVKEREIYTISSQDSNKYFIKEGINGTSILYGNILNGSKALLELKSSIDYAVFDEQLLDHELFLKLLDLTKKVLDKSNLTSNEEMSYISDMEGLIGNDTSFFDKKTIYKVKKDEKN